MKKRPIIFSSPMVRAILDGRKTMTRRVALKAIKGDQYLKDIEPYIRAIQSTMKDYNDNPMKAALELAHELEAKGFGGSTIMKVIAAAVELSETHPPKIM